MARSAMKNLLLFVCWLLFMGCDGRGRSKSRVHRARIMERPVDVPVVKCGDDIKLTCLAEGEPAPDVEWWFYNRQQRSNKTVIRTAGRDGRVRVKVEEFYVVRSTLMIKNAEEGDEGVYQCRASNNELRLKENKKVYLHWQIEEAPVGKVLCKDSVTTTTQVFPASEYSQAVFDDVIERTMASSVTPSTMVPKSKDHGRKSKEDPMPDPVVTSQTKIATSSKPAKIPAIKLTRKPTPKKPVKSDKYNNEIEKPPIKRGSRNDVMEMREKEPPEETTTAETKKRKEALVISTTTTGTTGSETTTAETKKRKEALVISTTTIGTTGSAQDSHRKSNLLFLLHLPVAAYIVTKLSL